MLHADDLERKSGALSHLANHKGKIIFLCTEDWYFWSHRLPIARAARGAGLHVIVVTRVQAHGQRLLAEGFDVRALGWRRRGDGLLGSLRALIAICRLYRRERPQLVHHIALKAVIFGAVAAFFARVPHQVPQLSRRPCPGLLRGCAEERGPFRRAGTAPRRACARLARRRRWSDSCGRTA